MSEIWGDLSKSQVDPSTINEEIDLMIVNHLNDPDAHLEIGQSLQSHKASEIIDHLAHSIIEDKIATGEISSRCITTDQIIGKDIRTAEDVGSTVDGVSMLPSGIEMWQAGEKKVDIPINGNPSFAGNVKVQSLEYSKFTLQTLFESLDGWSKSAGVSNEFGAVEIQSGIVINTPKYLYAGVAPDVMFYPDITKNPIFDTILYVTGASGHISYFGFGIFDEATGAGFKVSSSNLYAVWFDENNEEQTDLISAFDDSVYHRYRIEIEYGVEVRWYYDGVLAIQKTWLEIDTLWIGAASFNYYIKYVSGNQSIMYILNALFQQDF
jgi:hypothetical protein